LLNIFQPSFPSSITFNWIESFSKLGRVAKMRRFNSTLLSSLLLLLLVLVPQTTAVHTFYPRAAWRQFDMLAEVRTLIITDSAISNFSHIYKIPLLMLSYTQGGYGRGNCLKFKSPCKKHVECCEGFYCAGATSTCQYLYDKQ
jgi:hypothetical protein